MGSEEMITISRAEYQEFLNLRTEAEKFKSEIEWLKHQLAQLQKMIFGSKSERHIIINDRFFIKYRIKNWYCILEKGNKVGRKSGLLGMATKVRVSQ